MNSNDAKNPQFDAAWWKKVKSKAADPKGAFEKTLKDYEGALKTFLGQSKNSLAGNIDAVQKALQAIQKEATIEKNNKNLGVFQKDTLAGLSNYIKIAGAAIKHIQTFEKSPIMTAKVDVLVKNIPQFKEYCTKNFQAENFNFMALMYKNATKRFVYDDFVKPGAKFQANLVAGTVNQFEALAKAITAGKFPDNDKTWATAPWGKAKAEIEGLLRTDVLPRFRHYTLYTLLKDKLPS